MIDVSAMLVLLGLLLTGISHLAFPATYWIKPRAVIVSDGVVGQPVTLRVDRAVKRKFKGEYHVYIRSLPGQVAYCEAHGNIRYRTDALLPDPVTLEWWAYSDPRCHGRNLKPGMYAMKTCWEIKLPLWLSREVCIDSPAFQITNQTAGEPFP